ncbi:MAG: alpha/beta hydrolase, partial [Planctomycetales bacterium]|nr:alpha/beta hydrolase [Planctomycetales bacterium]
MDDRLTRRAFSATCLGSLGANLALGDEPDHSAQNDAEKGNLNIATPTLGGKQFWSDRLVFRDLRVQRNVVTGHFRLLDEKNQRRAWGSFEHCREELDVLRREKKLAPLDGDVVVLLHGLFRSRGSMRKLHDRLAQTPEFTPINVGYPSTRGAVGEHAAALADVVAGLQVDGKIHFVAHSLGNLVIRHYLGDLAAKQEDATSRFGRMVMLGPPNHQPQIAQQLIPLDVSRQITGAAAWQLARGWDELEPKLATPPFPFGILAGGGGSEGGRNPLLSGDDDLVVTVESTRLAGAADFRVLPVYHSFMMNNETVQNQTLEFLAHGYFESV